MTIDPRLLQPAAGGSRHIDPGCRAQMAGGDYNSDQATDLWTMPCTEMQVG